MFDLKHEADAGVAATFAGAETQASKAASPNPPERPMSELPPWAWKTLVGVWGAFFLVIVALFAGHSEVFFNLGVIFVFGAMFFGVPLALIRLTRSKNQPAPQRTYLETLNGPMPRLQALAQMIMVPLILTFGIAVIGFIATHQP